MDKTKAYEIKKKKKKKKDYLKLFYLNKLKLYTF